MKIIAKHRKEITRTQYVFAQKIWRLLFGFSSPACRLLFLKLKAQNEKEKFAFCSVKGCERIRIKAVIPKTAGVSDCEATAYPKYIETPIVEVPMPKKLSSAQLVKQLISYHRIIAHVNLAHIVPTDIRKTLCQGQKKLCLIFWDGSGRWNNMKQILATCREPLQAVYLVFWSSDVTCCSGKHRVKTDELEQVGPVNVILEPPAPPGCKNSSDRQGTEQWSWIILIYIMLSTISCAQSGSGGGGGVFICYLGFFTHHPWTRNTHQRIMCQFCQVRITVPFSETIYLVAGWAGSSPLCPVSLAI